MVDTKLLIDIVRREGLKGYVEARGVVIKELLTVCSQLGSPRSIETYGDLCSIFLEKIKSINDVLLKKLCITSNVDKALEETLKLETPLLRSDKGVIYTVVEERTNNHYSIKTIEVLKGFYMERLGLARILERNIKT